MHVYVIIAGNVSRYHTLHDGNKLVHVSKIRHIQTRLRYVYRAKAISS